MTGHPLGAVGTAARALHRHDVAHDRRVGTVARCGSGGLLTGLRETRTKRGQRMGFGQLEDLEGGFELVIFSEPYEQHVALLREAQGRDRSADGGRGPVPLVVHGTLEEGDPPKILVRDVTRLDEAEEKLLGEPAVRVQAPEVTRDR